MNKCSCPFGPLSRNPACTNLSGVTATECPLALGETPKTHAESILPPKKPPAPGLRSRSKARQRRAGIE
jgi:hypothetical protein